MSDSASFPTSVWDGSSSTRTAALDNEGPLLVYREPDGADWHKAQNEVAAIETALEAITYNAGAGNTATVATDATAGFMFVPKMNGAPTGVPAAVPTGYVPIVYDYSGNYLWVYNAAWKKSTTYA